MKVRSRRKLSAVIEWDVQEVGRDKEVGCPVASWSTPATLAQPQYHGCCLHQSPPGYRNTVVAVVLQYYRMFPTLAQANLSTLPRPGNVPLHHTTKSSLMPENIFHYIQIITCLAWCSCPSLQYILEKFPGTGGNPIIISSFTNF